jgi:chromosome segregation ATPase
MSDDLSPAEQARAHRLSAQALYERNPNAFEASRYALREIADHLDPPEPPETVESLRAERDAEHDAWERTEDALRQCRDERDEARSDAAHWQEQFRLMCDESEDRKRQVEAVTAERDNAIYNADEADRWKERFAGEQEELVQALNKLSAANYTIARLRATHTEAEVAGERCKRHPRVWKAGDPEPLGVSRVQDDDGDQWVNTGNGWVMSGDGRAWCGVAMRYGPLTEVLDED